MHVTEVIALTQQSRGRAQKLLKFRALRSRRNRFFEPVRKYHVVTICDECLGTLGCLLSWVAHLRSLAVPHGEATRKSLTKHSQRT